MSCGAVSAGQPIGVVAPRTRWSLRRLQLRRRSQPVASRPDHGRALHRLPIRHPRHLKHPRPLRVRQSATTQQPQRLSLPSTSCTSSSTNHRPPRQPHPDTVPEHKTIVAYINATITQIGDTRLAFEETDLSTQPNCGAAERKGSRCFGGGESAVLTIRRLALGSGFKYLMESIAVGDGPAPGTSLAAYYEASGTPPGVWMGAGLGGLAGGAGRRAGVGCAGGAAGEHARPVRRSGHRRGVRAAAEPRAGAAV